MVHDREQELFCACLDLAPTERRSYLERVCHGNSQLQDRIARLLAAHERAESFTLSPMDVLGSVAEAGAGATRTGGGESRIGECLGPWRLMRVIGHGGMGLVYGAARADGQYELEVALKLMRAGFNDSLAVERFRTERQVLASLEHPNIARLLDGGFASDGAPYLVMELVDGLPLTDWCRDRQTSLEERLRLFRVACDAVQHAHRALVVHRDLKPSNIFVSRAGVVKLLDFGIAKLLEPEAWGIEAPETRTEMRALTPEYAAPEQRHGGPITTATDVYALGVVLYELLTGVRPHFRGVDDDARAAEDVPTTETPPSEAVRRKFGPRGPSWVDPASAGPAESTSDLDPRRLARRMRGDLDRIVLKALRDEPERRYVSAGQLGEEIGRFLDGRPVLAQPDTLAYRFRKFVGRNRLAVLASALFVVSLAVFSVLSAWQARVLAEQRRAAQLERDTSNQVVRVLVDLFETTNPSVRPDGDRMPLGEFLQGARGRSLELLRDQPAVRAKLQQVFGLIHYTRGEYGPARQALEEALEEQRRLGGPDHPDALESLQDLGEIYHYGGEEERARALMEESLERHRRIYGERDPRTARVLHALAPVVAERDLDRAGELLHRALEIRREALGAGHPDVAGSLASLGGYYGRRGELERARGFYREALHVFPRPEDRRNPTAISILNDYASVLTRTDAHVEAEAMMREAIDLARQVLGPETLTAANLLNNLGVSRGFTGRHSEAERSFRAAFQMHLSLLGEDHRRTRNVARNVGRALALQQRYAEALPWMDRAITALPTSERDLDPGILGMCAQRAEVLFRLGRRDEALQEVRTAVDSLQRLPSATAQVGLASARVLLGRMLTETGRPQEAEAPLRAALEWFDRLGAEHPQRAEASCELGRARVLQGSRDEGWRRLEQCLPIYRTWGLAAPEVVKAVDQLRAARPS